MDNEVEALVYRVANAKLGEGPSVRCEGPTSFEKDIARDWVRRVLAAMPPAPAPPPAGDTGEAVTLRAAFNVFWNSMPADWKHQQKDWFALQAFHAGRCWAAPSDAALRGRVAELEALAVEAIDEIEVWAAYASDYFKDKHDLAGTLADLRARAHTGGADE